MGTKKGIVLGVCLLAVVCAGRVHADPSYLVYPGSSAIFRYDVNRYEVLDHGNPNFDSSFAIAGLMLWDRQEGRVPVELYRAPSLIGFQASPTGSNEFVTFSNDFDVIVDGFGTVPRTLGRLCLRFWPEPKSVPVQVLVDGVPIDALTAPLNSLEVSTAIPGGFYADTSVYRVSWSGAPLLEIVVFSDKNANGAFDGVPLYRIVAFDSAVSVESASWGAIKALYRD